MLTAVLFQRGNDIRTQDAKRVQKMLALFFFHRYTPRFAQKQCLDNGS